MAIALSKSDSLLNDEFKNFFKKCNPKFTERTLDILHYPYKKGNELKEILGFLKSRGFTKEELSNISSIWKSKYPGKSNLNKISLLVKSIKEEKSKLKRFGLLNKLVEYGESSPSLFIKNLLLSVGYGQIGNKGLLSSHFRKLISINEINYITDLTQEFVSERNRREYFKLVNELFLLLRESLDDVKLIRILDSNFHFLDFNGKLIQFESTSFDWSLSEIKENMSSSLYGQAYPSFWMKGVENRLSSNERNKLISKLEKLRIIENLSILDFWIFKDKIPHDDNVRNYVFKSLSSTYGESIASDYIIIDLLTNPIFKKNLSAINTELKKPTFSLKRNLLHKALRGGRETSFPIINLIEMGEEREDFIWWLIL